MAKIYTCIDQLIGGTPILELKKIERAHSLKAKLFAKLEYFNPAGSSKDRVALSIINDAEDRGLLKPGAVIVEPTSGNTGIGLACVAASRGYKAIIVMPDTMSIERRLIMAAYGAQVILTDGTLGMSGAIAKANEIAASIPGAIVAGQFDNAANPTAHYSGTGPEIFEDMSGNVDYFVAGVGTGGTISGAGLYLKEHCPHCKVIAVEPAGSPFLSENRSGPHGLQGIGAGFIPTILNTEIYDHIITVSEEDAYKTGREIGSAEGVLVGITSGAALWAALKIAKLPEAEGKNIVVLLPDSGERYLSTPMFSE